MSGIIDRTGDEVVTQDDNLADNVGIHDSIFFPGKKVAVAEVGGNQVCWNCFDPLLPGVCMELMLGSGLIRVCQEKTCVRRVMSRNAEKQKDSGAGKPTIG